MRLRICLLYVPLLFFKERITTGSAYIFPWDSPTGWPQEKLYLVLELCTGGHLFSLIRSLDCFFGQSWLEQPRGTLEKGNYMGQVWAKPYWRPRVSSFGAWASVNMFHQGHSMHSPQFVQFRGNLWDQCFGAQCSANQTWYCVLLDRTEPD